MLVKVGKAGVTEVSAAFARRHSAAKRAPPTRSNTREKAILPLRGALGYACCVLRQRDRDMISGKLGSVGQAENPTLRDRRQHRKPIFFAWSGFGFRQLQVNRAADAPNDAWSRVP